MLESLEVHWPIIWQRTWELVHAPARFPEMFWIVTPLISGRMPLQLSVSTRVVGRDGLAAARVLPEQLVGVRVSPNYASWGRKAAVCRSAIASSRSRTPRPAGIVAFAAPAIFRSARTSGPQDGESMAAWRSISVIPRSYCTASPRR